MAPRHKVRRREAQLAFEALSIEGGLISPEWLARVAQLDAGHQSEADYRIPKGLNLRDEIGRYWRIAQAHWTDFAHAWAAGTATRQVTEQFVTALLKDCLGFGSLAGRAPVTKGERTYPLAWAALEARVPVVIVAPRRPANGEKGNALDDLSPELGDAGRRRSAFGLAQEYLNAEEDALWGIVSDGLTLRLCRDNASLTRPAWIEGDLDRIFREERYSDFAALWLLGHESRFGAPGQLLSACHLETWRAAGREEGTRAREFLRDGVEAALVALGKGFLANPENQALRAALHDGKLSANEYFQELLRLVYRLIFLLTAEERDLLHPAGVSDPEKARYAQGYGLRRLRDRAVKRSAHDRFGDLWEALKIVLRGVGTGEPRLGLPALGGLFAADQCPHLDAAKLENRALLTAVFRLSWLRGDSGLARVNWRDMGPEELGSVYESLLELVPVIPPDHRGFSFATDETKGNARKTTGSYYTPDSLVQMLLDSALEPVIQATATAHPGDPVEALLKLSIVDPACGSGHFLLAAARRLAVHVARYQAKGTPSAEQYRHAIRQVVSRCLYGVDLNPMAVELCRVSLWMEAVEPGRPLSFLDSHIQRGNALLGATPALMSKGIPDAAFEAIEGDDKKTASLLKKKNKAGAEGQRGLDALWSKPAEAESAEVAKAVAALEAAPDGSLEEIATKEARWEGLQQSIAFSHQKFVADAWCAAFVWPKPSTEPKNVNSVVAAAPTNELWRQIRDGQGKPPADTVNTVAELASQYHFFHWHLAFPQVYARGGFDVALGNPPYLSVQSNVIPKPALHLLRALFPTLEKIGDFAALFADAATAKLKRNGAFGLVLPSTILVNLSFTKLRQALLERGVVTDVVQLGDGAFPGAVVPTCLVAFALRSEAGGVTRVSLRDARTGEFQKKTCVLREIASAPHYVFAVEQDERSARLIRGIRQRAGELREHLDIKEGIKTGDDAKFLGGVPFPSMSRRIVRGRDIDRFTVRPLLHIKYDRDALSRPQRLEMFEVPEKLFIRRVGRSLTAAYDGSGLLCLHTLYVARPRPGTPCKIKYLLAVLNSNVMNWIYGQLHMKKGEVFAEVRIHALNGLPIIVPSDDVQDRVVQLAETIEAERGSGDDASKILRVEDILEKEIRVIYGVTSEDLDGTQ